MSTVIGHQKILDFFNTAVEKDNLSHAYCMVGPDYVGKSSLVKKVCRKLLADNLDQSPDFKEVKTRDSQEIRVDQIREARSFVATQPHGKRKILLIQEGEKMNESAANAFLKTLEEPSEDTIIFVLLTDENSLPDTINSRCQTLYVRPVSQTEIKEYLQEQELDPEVVAEISSTACGLPEKAREWAKNFESFTDFKEKVDILNKLIDKPFYKKANTVNEFYNNYSRDQLQEFFREWQLGLHLYLQDKIELKLSSKQVKTLLQQLHQSKEKLRKNMNKKLILDQILQVIP